MHLSSASFEKINECSVIAKSNGGATNIGLITPPARYYITWWEQVVGEAVCNFDSRLTGYVEIVGRFRKSSISRIIRFSEMNNAMTEGGRLQRHLDHWLPTSCFKMLQINVGLLFLLGIRAMTSRSFCFH